MSHRLKAGINLNRESFSFLIAPAASGPLSRAATLLVAALAWRHHAYHVCTVSGSRRRHSLAQGLHWKLCGSVLQRAKRPDPCAFLHPMM